jgi:hypothetical protein
LNKSFRSLIPLLLLGAACSPRISGFSNVQRFRLSHDAWPQMYLLQAPLNNRLAFSSREGLLWVGGYTLGSLSEQVDEVLLSPGQRYLALISVGEGHPILDVYEVEALLAALENGETDVPPLHSLNPYPGSVFRLAWESPALLRFESDMDFSLPDSLRGFPPDSAPLLTWRLNAVSGQVE